MEIVKYEGYNLQELIDQAKKEYGEDVKILSYEVENERRLLLFPKKRYRLFVQIVKNEESFLDLLSKEEKNQQMKEERNRR